MRRAVFLGCTGAMALIPSLVDAGDLPLDDLQIFRAAPISQEDGGQLYDVTAAYAFPSTPYETVYVSGYGYAAPFGYIRFVTSAASVVVREVLPDGTLGNTLAERSLERVQREFENLAGLDLGNVDDVARSLIAGAALYGLGRDAAAIREYTGVLWANKQGGVWSAQARLGRADAYANIGDYLLSIKDFSWVIDHPRIYNVAVVAGARLGRARIRNITGDLNGALSDYQEAGRVYRSLAAPRGIVATTGPSAIRIIREALLASAGAQKRPQTRAADLGAAAVLAEIGLYQSTGVQVVAGADNARHLKNIRTQYNVDFTTDDALQPYDKVDQSEPWIDKLTSGRFSIGDLTNHLGNGTYFWGMKPSADLANTAFVSTWSTLSTGGINAEMMRCSVVLKTVASDANKHVQGIPYRAKVLLSHRRPRAPEYDPTYDPAQVNPALMSAGKDLKMFLESILRAIAIA